MSFTVPPGQVTGFVGPNGAGKSTTMRVILGLDAADAGTALVGGGRTGSLRRPLRHVGSLLDAGALQPSRTARNHLLWLAHSQGLPARRVDEVLEQAGLAAVARRRAGGFSLGMRQRLGIAAALLGDPPALMLDEPFNGMDPEGIVWMRGFLRSLAAEGRAVLVSSHLMSELQDTADHVVVVGRGRVIADAAVADLLAAASRRPGHPADRGGRGPRRSWPTPARAVTADRARHADRDRAAAGDGGGRCSAEAGVPFSEVSAHRATLEEAYLELTRDAVEFRGGWRAMTAPAARRVDEAPHRPRLGGRDGRWRRVVIVASGWLPACRARAAGTARVGRASLPVGPGGEEVADRFTFVHRPLTGDGSITVRVAVADRRDSRRSTATGPRPGLGAVGQGRPDHQGRHRARARRTRRSCSPAATACGCSTTSPTTSPAAGTAGAALAAADPHRRHASPAPSRPTAPPGPRSAPSGCRACPRPCEAGLFVTSPQYTEISREALGLSGASGGPTRATATFDQPRPPGRLAGAGLDRRRHRRAGDADRRAPPRHRRADRRRVHPHRLRRHRPGRGRRRRASALSHHPDARRHVRSG